MSPDCDPHRCTVDIEALDGRGHGIATVDGTRLTVPMTLPGERVDTHLRYTRGRLTGTVSDIRQPSAHRVETHCEFAAFCPGCTLRHVHHDYQQTLRLARVQRALNTLSQPIPSPEILGALPRDNIRSRVIAHAMRQPNGQLTLGMRSRRGDAVPLSKCPVHTLMCRSLLGAVEADLNELGIEPYDEITRTGLLRHVLIEEFESHLGGASNGSHRRQRIVLALGQAADEEVFRFVAARDFPDSSLLIEVLPYRGSSSISKPKLIRGDASIWLPVDDDQLQATLPAWTPQVAFVSSWLREKTMEWLGPRRDDRILEVGCGVGTLSLTLARTSQHLVAIDACRTAINDAKLNAERHGLVNIEFRVGVANKALIRLLNRGDRYDKAVLHAMRRPFGARAMSVIAAFRPNMIMYIGPSARSIAEDLQELREYTCVRAGIIDQTPGTLASLSIFLLHLNPS